MSPNIHGELEKINEIEKHIETLNRKQVIECLKLLLDEKKFQHVSHWMNHCSRRKTAENFITRLKAKKGTRVVGRAKRFLNSCIRNDPFNECEQFLDVGDFVEVISFAGKPAEYRRRNE